MGWVTTLASDEQVEYRLFEGAGCGLAHAYRERERPHVADVDRQVGYRLRDMPTPLEWVGSGPPEVGITPGTKLTGSQKDAARAVMNGVDPRTGEVLVEAKLAVDPRGTLPAVALANAFAALGPEPFALDSRPGRRLARLLRCVARQGEAHRIPYRDAEALASAGGLDLAELYDPVVLATVRKHADDRVRVGLRGYDVTFDLPKSASALWALGDGQLADALGALHLEAVREAVAALEGWAGYTLRGHRGDGRAGERLESTGLLGWIMPHQVARPVDGKAPDPHLHAHVVLANLARTRADGKWRTIGAGGRDVHRHAHAADSLAKARFRALTAQRLGMAWARDERTGAWEVVGIPPELRTALSKRTGQILALLGELGIGEASTAQDHAAAARSREAASPPAGSGELRAAWRAQADAVEVGGVSLDVEGMLARSVPAARTDALPPLPGTEELAAALLDPASGVTAHRKALHRADLIAAVLDVLPYTPDLATAERLVEELVAGGHLLALPTGGQSHLSNAARYTTPDILAAERTITAAADAGYGAGAAVVPADTAAMAVSAFEAGHGFELSAQQRQVVHRLLTAGHGVDAVIGVAGAGKTTLLAAARAGWQAAGLVVAGASTAAVACANLQAESGITSRTLASWLRRIDTGPGLTGVDVLVIDEAAMSDDRQIAAVTAAAQVSGTKLVLLGDPMQLRSPGVGGSFAAIHRIVGGLTLGENRRQRDQTERAALAAWRAGDRRKALGTWAGSGRVHHAQDAAGALTGMLGAWNRARARYPDPHELVARLLLLAGTNDAVERLNAGARALRAAAGELGPERAFALAGGGRAAFAVGDVVMTRRNDYRAQRTGGAQADVLNGHRGVVTEVDRTGVTVRVELGAPPVHLPAAYIAAGGLQHAYAMTVAKSQGLSAEVALVYGAGLDAHTLYPAMSRDRHRADLWLPRDLLEDEATRIRLGEPATPGEALARAVDGYARALEATAEDIMVSVELGDRHTDRTPTPATIAPAPALPAPRPERPAGHLSDAQLAAAIRRARAAITAGAEHARLDAAIATGRGPEVQRLHAHRDTVTTAAGAIDALRAARARTAAANAALDTALAEQDRVQAEARRLAALRGLAAWRARTARAALTPRTEANTAALAAARTHAERAAHELASADAHAAAIALPAQYGPDGADLWDQILAARESYRDHWPAHLHTAHSYDLTARALAAEKPGAAPHEAARAAADLDTLTAEAATRTALTPQQRDAENTTRRRDPAPAPAQPAVSGRRMHPPSPGPTQGRSR